MIIESVDYSNFINIEDNNRKYDVANVNIAAASIIAAAVNIAAIAIFTAAARVHMSKFKNLPDTKLYYSDNDSIVINKPMDPKFVNNELGNLKLECFINKAVFIAPKIYALVTSDNEEIIQIKGLSKEAFSKNNVDYYHMFGLLDRDAYFTDHRKNGLGNFKIVV